MLYIISRIVNMEAIIINLMFATWVVPRSGRLALIISYILSVYEFLTVNFCLVGSYLS